MCFWNLKSIKKCRSGNFYESGEGGNGGKIVRVECDLPPVK